MSLRKRARAILGRPTSHAATKKEPASPQIVVTRAGRSRTIDPQEFEGFLFQDGDQLTVIPETLASDLPTTWGDVNIKIAEGHAVRVPAHYHFYDFKGFRIPSHLISLTGSGPETLDAIGRAHIQQYRESVGLSPDKTLLDVGCGIGRDAFQLLDVLSPAGRYIGVDVTRDSIVWCQDNITRRFPNFHFRHLDAFNELYNPHGAVSAAEIELPVENCSVDRIVLSSVFTHMLEDEVVRYMQEFRRVLRSDGLVYASFFLHSPEAIKSAQERGTTPWKATFARSLGNGVYANDPSYPRGAVAFTDEAMRRMVGVSGLSLKRSYLKGAWSGLHANPDGGQDAAILGLPD